jgi:alpha-L-fucosidase
MNADSNYVGDFGTPEKQIPDTGIVNMHWETCMTMNDTWGYKTFDDDWKSTETLIHQLIDAVSKGGNYLLNVGPKANGVIPDPSVVRLQEIGRWMDVNEDAIYGAEASPYQRPEWGRFTSGEDMLFAHVFNWPEDQTLQVPQISERVSTAAVWTEKGPLVLDKEQGERGLTLIVPETAPDPVASVIAIEYRD